MSEEKQTELEMRIERLIIGWRCYIAEEGKGDRRKRNIMSMLLEQVARDIKSLTIPRHRDLELLPDEKQIDSRKLPDVRELMGDVLVMVYQCPDCKLRMGKAYNIDDQESKTIPNIYCNLSQKETLMEIVTKLEVAMKEQFPEVCKKKKR